VAVDHGQAQRIVRRETKIRLITILLRRVISEIKLKRTDTTLDLSQKAKRAKEERRKENSKNGGEGGAIFIGYGSRELVEPSAKKSCVARARVQRNVRPVVIPSYGAGMLPSPPLGYSGSLLFLPPWPQWTIQRGK
jgi:hypothetical protein